MPTKKKKPAKNPARGFATTSTASKAKPHDNEEDNFSVDVWIADDKAGISQERMNVVGGENEKHLERPLHELSPEELEKQLEESTLQVFIENHGDRVKKDVSRHLSKLQTERRLLRSQAIPLSTHQWLPEEIMQFITSHIEGQQGTQTPSERVFDSSDANSRISEDDLLIKVWILRQLLPQLGFSLENTNLALHHLLATKDKLDRKHYHAGKDSVWRLEECLFWLAFAAKSEDLPSFQLPNTQKLSTRNRKLEDAKDVGDSGSNTSTTTPSYSRPPTPLPEASPRLRDHPADADALQSAQSESDSDLEPEQLIEKYLDLQRRLYEIDPQSFEPKARKQNTSERGLSSTKASNNRNINRSINRLTAKLNKIQRDILFDESEAKRKWAVSQVALSREAAERRRLGIRDNRDLEKRITTTDAPIRAEVQKDDGGDADMLGGLFTAITDLTSDISTESGTIGSDGTAEAVVKVRDFGKWTGVSPRKVFEEACRTRDAYARIRYKLISESTFSRRHSLTVHWSRAQGSPAMVPIESVLAETNIDRFKVEMLSIACPDVNQSEAYVSTIALFLLFASTSEHKVFMRLPSVWRGLWEELSVLSKEYHDANDRDVLRGLRSMIEDTEKGDEPITRKGTIAPHSNGPKQQGPEPSLPGSLQQSLAPSSNELKALWMAKEQTSSYQRMLPIRMKLPMYSFKQDLLFAISDRQIVIVCVPAYVLENELSNGRACRVYCTEPRRISAISLARRVSEELGEKQSEFGTSRSLVGYAIRLESRMTSQTRLVYATTGIVMRMLEGTDELAEVTHLILDEVHERTIDSDFLLIVLRKLLIRRHDLKVILMSATVNAQRFSAYLDHAPILNVPGRTFPVETKYLEDAIEETHFNPAASSVDKYRDDDDDDIDRTADVSARSSLSAENLRQYSADTCNTLLEYDEYRLNYDLMLKLLVTIASVHSYSFYSKAILVFLPGITDIRRLNNMLAGHSSFQNGWNIHSLHSTIAMEEQERAFLVPPPGIRKIVLATNIAETGITIPDVTCVVDTGKHKEMRFDERRQLSRLIEVFISRANAKQRRGRAGRVQKGLCFHLFTRNRHDNVMPEEQTPEMLRLSLQDLVLRVKTCKLGGIEQTLSEALDPPSSRNIRRAIDSLVDVKALTTTEELTPLGRQLAKLPLDVFVGKLVLLGAIFGCLDAMLTIAAMLSSKSPFTATIGARAQSDIARLAFKKGDSDLLTNYNAYCAWRRACHADGVSEYQFCRKNFLSQQSLANIEDLKMQLAMSLVDAGFIKLEDSEKASRNKARFYSGKRGFFELPNKYTCNESNDLILNSVIAWAFYPKLLRREGKGWRNVANNQVVSLHPTSVNKSVECPAQWLSFYHVMQATNKFYNAHETSVVEDFAVALVCGEAEFKMYSGPSPFETQGVLFPNKSSFGLLYGRKSSLPVAKQEIEMSQLRLKCQMIKHLLLNIFSETDDMPPSNPTMFRMKKRPPAKLTRRISSPILIVPSSTPPERPNVQTNHKSSKDHHMHHMHHPTYSRDFPMRRLLVFLPKSTLLNLRLVSRACCNLVSTATPSIFSHLHVDFPISSLHTLECAARNCHHLTISFPLAPQPLTKAPTPSSAKLPSLPTLTHLHIITPITSTFSTLLTFRLALQSADVPNLTHVSIANCTINGILALRWGTFTSFAYSGSTCRDVWRSLKGLSVSLIPWWDATSPQSQNHQERDTHRTNLKILHDWLNTFATHGSLSELRFTWKSHDGPNPLLLDTFSFPGNKRKAQGFGTPPVQWRGLKEVWLRGVQIDANDVLRIKERIPDLERLTVQSGREGETVRGRRVVVEDGREWLEVWVGDGGAGRMDDDDRLSVEVVDTGTEGPSKDSRNEVWWRRGAKKGTLTAEDIMRKVDEAVKECLEAEESHR